MTKVYSVSKFDNVSIDLGIIGNKVEVILKSIRTKREKTDTTSLFLFKIK